MDNININIQSQDIIESSMEYVKNNMGDILLVTVVYTVVLLFIIISGVQVNVKEIRNGVRKIVFNAGSSERKKNE